ncbi:MAG: hypothetical protein KGI54_16830 [Pseudomonadota bacterium]|nr:hypothetical protein [Pseudomonadota bacterium]
MITRPKREWCAMLAKLTSPMDPETAARAFVDMLPMLPPDDTLYTRQTLDAAATCDRRTSVPTFADISRVLGEAQRASLPYDARNGYTGPQFPALAPAKPMTPEERKQTAAVVAQKVAALKAEMARDCRVMPEANRPEPKYLTPLQLALAARQSGAIMRPDWAAVLADYEG